MKRSFLLGWLPETFCHAVFCKHQQSQLPGLVPTHKEKQTRNSWFTIQVLEDASIKSPFHALFSETLTELKKKGTVGFMSTSSKENGNSFSKKMAELPRIYQKDWIVREKNCKNNWRIYIFIGLEGNFLALMFIIGQRRSIHSLLYPTSGRVSKYPPNMSYKKMEQFVTSGVEPRLRSQNHHKLCSYNSLHLRITGY